MANGRSCEHGPLDTMPTGKRCLIDSVDAEGALSRRLRDLGFAKGAEIITICRERGALMVSLKEQTFALSSGIGSKISVKCI